MHLSLLLAVLCGAEAPPAGQFVSYPSGKEQVRGFLCRPVGQGPFPAVIIIHGDYGLGNHEKQLARRLAGQGYVAVAVDLYRGTVVSELLDAHILDRGLPEAQALGDLRAAVDFLVSRADVRRDAIGIFGWDMGGGYALDAARRDDRLRAVVTCYGRLTTDPALLAKLNASVFGVFAGKDLGITPKTIEQFRAAMRKAGKRVAGLETYPNCEHGFLNPHGGTRPEAAAVADAWRRIDAYLAESLKR